MADGKKGVEYLLIQPVDEQDLSAMEQEVSYIREHSAASFLLLPVGVADWNRDLSPWPAPPVFGKEAFGDGAGKTLRRIQEEVLPEARRKYDLPQNAKLILGGYSLAGLFALWCGHETDDFVGIAAASPSVWFPGFLDYARQYPLKTKAVYLSLGDKEERARSPVMRQVGDCIRSLYTLYENAPEAAAALQWNEGNHFRDPGMRMAKAFVWTMEALQ